MYIPSWFYKNQLGFFMPKFLYIAISRKGVAIKFEKKGGSQSMTSKCKVIAIANQKRDKGKTTTTVNLGVGLINEGKKVLLIDADPQGDLTTSLGWVDQDNFPVTLATHVEGIIRDKSIKWMKECCTMRKALI
jgi:uncharacterized NAD-dependent epimerase/dehydratase family protein